MTTVTSREFNQDVSAAKRAATHGPVVVTDRGEPAYVLLSIGEYERLTQGDMDRFLARMRMTQDVDVDFSPARIDAHVPDL
ncbi:MAG: type II toxin-antitoxin system prevent-host-death family antitoxin [Brachybacterium faecium]|nr:MAG: type II toxin-antitoxin system prevent-host-death family antitoxin [Brachybacterium faecium]